MSKLDRIKALLRKAENKGATEAEAFAAMQLAMKLMAKEGLTEADIAENNEEANAYIERRERSANGYLHPIDRLLARAIADFCTCKVFAERPAVGWHTVGFFGHEADVELAYFIRATCMSALDAAWHIHSRYVMAIGQVDVRAERQSFVAGFCKRMTERLKEYSREQKRASTGTDLIIAKKNQLEVKLQEAGLMIGRARRGSNGKRYGHSEGAYAAGRAAGNSVDMGRPVTNSKTLRIGKS